MRPYGEHTRCVVSALIVYSLCLHLQCTDAGKEAFLNGAGKHYATLLDKQLQGKEYLVGNKVNNGAFMKHWFSAQGLCNARHVGEHTGHSGSVITMCVVGSTAAVHCCGRLIVLGAGWIRPVDGS